MARNCKEGRTVLAFCRSHPPSTFYSCLSNSTRYPRCSEEASADQGFFMSSGHSIYRRTRHGYWECFWPTFGERRHPVYLKTVGLTLGVESMDYILCRRVGLCL